jgi:hypothetical protein
MVTMAWLSCEYLGRPWAEARRWVVIIAKLSCEHQGRKSTLSWQSDTNYSYSRTHVNYVHIFGSGIAADVCAFYVWPSQSTTSSIATRVGIGGFEGGLQEKVR